MSASELFGVAVRTIGLWIISQGVLLMTALQWGVGSIVGIAMYLIVGSILFFGANGFVRTAYGRSSTGQP